jgi:hypothetical protein
MGQRWSKSAKIMAKKMLKTLKKLSSRLFWGCRKGKPL